MRTGRRRRRRGGVGGMHRKQSWSSQGASFRRCGGIVRCGHRQQRRRHQLTRLSRWARQNALGWGINVASERIQLLTPRRGIIHQRRTGYRSRCGRQGSRCAELGPFGQGLAGGKSLQKSTASLQGPFTDASFACGRIHAEPGPKNFGHQTLFVKNGSGAQLQLELMHTTGPTRK